MISVGKTVRGRRGLCWHVVIVAVAVCAARGQADACTTSNRYDYRVNVGVLLGLSIFPKIHFTYGLDLRIGRGPEIGFARLEGYGLDFVRTAIGAELTHGAGDVEAGLAWSSAHQNEDVKGALGVHVAAGVWNPLSSLNASGSIPVVGDRGNYDAGLGVAWVVPGGIPSLIGCPAADSN